MYHPTSRVLAVLEMLYAHDRLTGAELAERLEVNVRTLRRYIVMLQDLGIPIIADRGRNGAYALGAGFKLPPMMFTNEEAVALEIGLLAASQLGLTENAAAIQSARAKLEHVMPLELKNRVRALSDTITLNSAGNPIPASSHVMMIMSGAVQQKQRVHIRYYSSAEDVTERDLDPYGIAFRYGKWYVVGWCHLREAMRSFRMDRVAAAQLTETHFDRVEPFDPLVYVEQAIATLPRQYRFEVLLKADFATIQREIFDVFGVLEPHAEGMILRGSADNLVWVAGQLATFSFEFVVYEPPELRAALRELANALMRLANAE